MKLENKSILITGGTGFLGSEIYKQFQKKGYENVSIIGSECDLRNKAITIGAIYPFDIVIHCAANCGGIGYNRKFPGTLFYENMLMGMNVLEACRLNHHLKKLILIGTVCAYPKFTDVPFLEDDLWNGYPEETNAPYGLAKRELLTMAQAYKKEYGMNIIYLIPVNMYGENDRGFFNEERSHVIPAMIKKIIDAKISNSKEVRLWGSGEVSREFLYVSDCARAIYLATEYYDKINPVNIGTGEEIKIRNLAKLIAYIVGYDGEIIWDVSKPDGQPRRCLNVERAEDGFGFKAEISLEEGLKKTIDWYKNERKKK